MMKKIYKIASGLFLSTMLLGSCSDEMEVDSIVADSENRITISLNLEEEELVRTRELQNGQEKLTLPVYAAFFDKGATDESICKYCDYSYYDTSDNTMTFYLPRELRAAEDWDIFLFTNVTRYVYATFEEYHKGNTYKQLMDYLTSFKYEGYITMSGKAVKKGERLFSVDLKRIKAKTTVKLADDFKVVGMESFKIENITYYNVPEKGRVMAGYFDETDERVFTYGTEIEEFEEKDGVYSAYTYATKTIENSSDGEGAYLILKASYDNSTYCYYRLDFPYEKEGVTLYFNLLPNHWYEMEISEVNHPGYKTAEEAKKHPMGTNMKVTIHDHAANVYTMISDGSRELGIQSNIEIKAAPEKSYFTVKIFSPNKNDYNEEPVITINSKQEWLKVSDESIEDNELSGTHSGDDDSVGKAFKFELSNIYPYNLGLLEAEIKVDWKGLSRTGKVSFNQEFDPSDVVTVSLETKNAHIQDTYIEDYFAFLKGKTTTITHNGVQCYNTKLYGVSEEAMGPGMARDAGLHFPMPAEEPTSTVFPNYIYKFKFNQEKFPGAKITDVIGTNSYFKVEKTDGEVTALSSTIGPKISSATDRNYTYTTGKITLVVTYGDGEVINFPFDYYRCGFFTEFEQGSNLDNYRVDPHAGDYGYYYYEVVQIGGLSRSNWLDRNIGAKSRGMYIQNSEGASVFPSGNWPYMDNSSGGYYKPAAYVAYANPEDNLYDDLCPKGYRIPNRKQWESLTDNYMIMEPYKSSSTGVTYYTSYVESDNAGRVYFPKSRYYNGSSLMGENRTGYYWTGTQATGSEKEEIGKWMQVLSLSGNSAAYIFGDVSNYGMSVRPIATFDQYNSSMKEYTLSLNVKGATNVYVYRYYAGNRTGLMEWPGKAVMDVEAAKSNKTVNFTFNTTNNVNDTSLPFFVVFTFVENGVTKIISASSSGGLESPDISPKDVRGWRYVQGASYNFTYSNGTITKDSGWSSDLYRDSY